MAKIKILIGLFIIFSNNLFAQKISEDSLDTIHGFVWKIKQQREQKVKRKANFNLPFYDKKSIQATVNYDKIERGENILAGRINDHNSSSFILKYTNEKVTGKLIFEEEKKAYEYYTESGKVKLKEVDIDNIMCIGYTDSENLQWNPKGANLRIAAPPANDPVYNLQSMPSGAKGAIILDFDGQTIDSPYWNDGNTINATPSQFTADEIMAIFKAVSEDFAPFKLNVTTNEAVYNSYPGNRRTRCIFTPNKFNRPMNELGVAIKSSFKDYETCPCWVFTVDYGSDPILRYANTASHEIGHTLGLSHDGTTTQSYYYGHGNWRPIMGSTVPGTPIPPIAQWSKGEYQNANNGENDLANIAGMGDIGFRDDEPYGTQLVLDASRNVIPSQNKGIISRPEDLDYFHFYVTKTSKVSFIGTPSSVSPNLDISLQLFKNTDPNDLIINMESTFNSIGPCTLNAIIAPGHYYLRVDGNGDGNPFNTGYSDYGSLGYYEISGNIVDFCDPVPTPIITGSDQYCVNASAHTRSFGLINASSYAAWTWTISPASSYLSIQYPNATETSTTLNVAANYTGTYTITATGSNGCGQTASASMNITVASSAPTGAVSVVGGPATVNSTDKSIHQATLVAGKKEWEITPSGAYTNYNRLTYERVEIDWNDAYSGTATLRVRNTNGCGAGPWSASTNVTVCGPSNTLTVNGPSTIDNSENTVFSANLLSGTQTWTISPANAVLSQKVLPYARLSVIWNPTFTGNVTASVQSNGYCSSAPKTFTVTSGQCDKWESNNTQAEAYYIISSHPTMDPDRRISGQLPTNDDRDWYYFSNGAGGKNIKITLSNLAADFELELYDSNGNMLQSSINGSNSPETIIYNTTNVGNYYILVRPYYYHFNSQCYYLNLELSSTPFARVGSDFTFVEKEKAVESFSVSPNPTESGTEVFLTIPSDDASSYQRVSITDINGRTVYETVTEFSSGQAMINPNNLKSGIYLIDIEGLGKKKLVVQ